MKIIPLTMGHFTVVDDADYADLSKFKWAACYGKSDGRWRARRRISSPVNKPVYEEMHRRIMQPPEGSDVDHVNQLTLDNRRENLRIATRSQNHANKGKSAWRRASSKYKGVCWSARWQKFSANCGPAGPGRFLGWFTDEIEAAIAYDWAARQIYGEFSRLNFPEITRAPRFEGVRGRSKK